MGINFLENLNWKNKLLSNVYKIIPEFTTENQALTKIMIIKDFLVLMLNWNHENNSLFQLIFLKGVSQS